MHTLFKNITISHVATAVPDSILELNSFSGLYGESEVKKIISSTGISKVRVAPPHLTTADLCEAAFREIISKSDLDTRGIGALVFVSQTADHRLPQTSIILQDKLGLSRETACFDIPLGCSGYVYGLFQSAMLIASGIEKVALLAGDTSTRIINERDRSVSMVFGDAGTATIIESGKSDMHISVRSDGSGRDKLIIPAGGCRMPSNTQTSKSREVEPGVFRSDDDLYMDGMAIMNFAISEVPLMISETLKTLDWKQEDVGCFALHQANAFMLNYLRKKMKLSIEKVPISVDGFGNTGPASIPLMLCDKAAELSKKNQLEKVVMCGFGVGLSWGTASTDLSSTIFYKPINI